MEKDILFTTPLTIAGEEKSYAVTFENEAYQFNAEGSSAPALRIRREDDEWKAEEDLDESILQQAISALESYLLSQH